MKRDFIGNDQVVRVRHNSIDNMNFQARHEVNDQVIEVDGSGDGHCQVECHSGSEVVSMIRDTGGREQENVPWHGSELNKLNGYQITNSVSRAKMTGRWCRQCDLTIVWTTGGEIKIIEDETEAFAKLDTVNARKCRKEGRRIQVLR